MIIFLLLLQNNFHDFPKKRSMLLKVFLALCLMHVLAIEHLLQENLVRTGEFRRNIVSIGRTIYGRDEKRTDTVWLFLIKIVNVFLKVPLFRCYRKLFKQKYTFRDQ